jgi:hypothetical protein
METIRTCAATATLSRAIENAPVNLEITVTLDQLRDNRDLVRDYILTTALMSDPKAVRIRPVTTGTVDGTQVENTG